MTEGPNIDIFQKAVQHHRAGRTGEAEAIYRAALVHHPAHPEALHLLGLLCYQSQRAAEGIELVRRAIRSGPKAEFHNNLGVMLADQGSLDDAIAEYRHAVSLRPDFAEAYSNLGSALQKTGQLNEAALALSRAAALRPDVPETNNELGIALWQKGELEGASRAFRAAVAVRADYPEAHNNLGVLLKETGDFDAAVAAHRRAVELRPDDAQFLLNLGTALREKGQLDEAIAIYRQVIAVRPDLAPAHNNLANVLKDIGQWDEALASYRRAEALSSDPSFASNLLYSLYFNPEYDAAQIYEEHVRWNAKYARPLAPQISHGNRASSGGGGKLRIGYVSPDLRQHPVGRFLLPLLAHHDHDAFEIYCYTDVRHPDSVTGQLRAGADVWHGTAGMPDAQLAELIRQDRIDILVDLTMHMSGSRLLVFARKPAPVQVTYLAYCGTTGLETMDYRLTDPYLDPRESDDRFYSERSVRLPGSYWCYWPPESAPPINPLPAASAGLVTFGCFNNFSKVSETALETWCDILREVPNSRLLLYTQKGSHRQLTRERVAQIGVDPMRLQFIARLPLPVYFGQYQQIDIALDPFPYPGGTTTCDALWMGVPVVSLAGATAVSRSGLSILCNVGLPELVVGTSEQYVQIAANLAHDVPRLTELRATLRRRMQSSALMDAAGFTRGVEAAYRQMWRDWLDSVRS